MRTCLVIKDQSMNILQVITELYPAGAERIVANLCIGLKEQGHNVAVVSIQPLPKNSIIVDELIENKIPIKSLNLTKFTPWRIFKLKKIIKSTCRKWKIKDNGNLSQQFSSSIVKQIIVHSHLIHANLVCRFNNIFGIKYQLINTIHIAEKRKGQWLYFWLDKLTLKYCNCQTAVSKAASEYHAKMLKISDIQIQIIHNGINPPKELTNQKIKNLRKEWSIDNCDKLIGSAGRLDWQKGYDILLKILPELSKRIPKKEKWGVVILGEGPKRQEFEELAQKIPDNITFILPGYRKDTADCIGAFDLFIMPSRYEGFGLTLVEAMAHGIPCLSSKADSLPELINRYPNGKTTDFSSLNCLNDILLYINKANIKWVNPFTTNGMVNNYFKLYTRYTKTNHLYLDP